MVLPKNNYLRFNECLMEKKKLCNVNTSKKGGFPVAISITVHPILQMSAWKNHKKECINICFEKLINNFKNLNGSDSNLVLTATRVSICLSSDFFKSIREASFLNPLGKSSKNKFKYIQVDHNLFVLDQWPLVP